MYRGWPHHGRRPGGMASSVSPPTGGGEFRCLRQVGARPVCRPGCGILGEGSPVTAMTYGRAGTVLKIPSAGEREGGRRGASAHVRGIHAAVGERRRPRLLSPSPVQEQRGSHSGGPRVPAGLLEPRRQKAALRVQEDTVYGNPRASRTDHLHLYECSDQFVGRRRAGCEPRRVVFCVMDADGPLPQAPLPLGCSLRPAVSTHSFAHGMHYSGFFTERQAGPKPSSRTNRGRNQLLFCVTDDFTPRVRVARIRGL